MPLDKSPFVVEEFMGELHIDEQISVSQQIAPSNISLSKVPLNYGFLYQNLDFLDTGGLRTRKGIDNHVSLNGVTGIPIQFWPINNLNGVPQTDRYLILTWTAGTTTGRLYDTGAATPTTPILLLSGMKYAFVLNAFGRLYITPWSDWASPLNGSSVYVYNGSATTARTAKAAAPAVGTFAVAAAAGGNATPGLHYVSVLFETDTGYISIPPSTHLLTPLSVTTTVANATMNFTNIPVGGAGTGITKRHIIVTKVVVNPNGRGLLGFEPFFAVTINDNTTTTSSFALPDSALVDSAADYLEDSVTLVPCVSMALYGSRLVYIGPKPTTNIVDNSVLVSPPNRPEQVYTQTSTFGGILTINGANTIYIGRDFPGLPTIGGELNATFYVFKEDSTFGIVANDDLDPNEWTKPNLIDAGKGAFPFGLCRIGNSPSNFNSGYFIVGGNHGISLFNGVFSDFSLSSTIWKTFLLSQARWLQLVYDPINKRLFALFVDLAALAGSPTIYIGKLIKTPDSFNVKWGRYTYSVHSGKQTSAFGILLAKLAGVTTSLQSSLIILDSSFVSGTTYNILTYKEIELTTDFGVDNITWEIDTGYTPNQFGEIYTFGPLKLRILSINVDGAINITKGLIDTSSENLITGMTVTMAPKKYYSININSQGEHLRLAIAGSFAGLIELQKLILFATLPAASALDRPRV